MNNISGIEKIEQYVIDEIRETRIKNGITQRELAIRLEVSEGFIANVENRNYRAKYNLKHINAIAKILKCSPKDFLPDKPL
jgi:transcriptional regulator with XRE-family HTH domain